MNFKGFAEWAMERDRQFMLKAVHLERGFYSELAEQLGQGKTRFSDMKCPSLAKLMKLTAEEG